MQHLHQRPALLVLLAACLTPACSDSGSNSESNPDGGADSGSDATNDGPLECFDFSLDPASPLALDGTFVADSPRWRRPHDETPVCPATGLLPETAATVPFVAYAFCNNDTVARTFDFSMLSQEGPADEPPLDDPYLLLYDGQMIQSDSRDCLGVNDDIPGALDSSDSELLGIEVAPGGSVTMVLTTFTFDPNDGTGQGYYIGVVSAAEE